MDETLIKAIELYSTKEPEELSQMLLNLSKPTLVSIFTDLLTTYFNDKNSSKLRELTTLWVCGWEPSMEKLGYNGYRMVFPAGAKELCEVKPQNTEYTKKKLNGGGSFNDYTKERFERDLRNNPTILTSRFVCGKLIYIFEFKFDCLKERLEQILDRRFPSERRKGEYVRSAQFSFVHYINCESLRLAFLRENWTEFRNYLSSELIEFFQRWNA